MILINTNRDEFTYDIHALVKAFYPLEDVVFHRESGQSYTRTIDVTIPNPEPNRRAAKDEVKRELYRRLSEETGTTLPWGALTGIRPTKIPMKLLNAGATEEEIYDHMRQTYFCSDKKIALSIEIARRELDVLSQIDTTDGYSLYVGIPFCPSTCLYCSFTSYPVKSAESKIKPYLDALDREIREMAAFFKGRRLNAVYVGGGTPTALEVCDLSNVLDKIKSSFDFMNVKEFTVEAGRPDSITREKLKVLKDFGVDRISVNPQTFSQRTLDLIGRRHTVEETVESFLLARELGFENINMDLIMGLPGETIEDVRHTMKEIERLRPDDVTIHSLAIKRASRLKLELDEYRQLQMQNSDARMDTAEESCRSIGLSPYYLYRQKNMAGNFENVGYAAPEKAGIYNILIMEEIGDIVACGAGTVSKRVHPLAPDDTNDPLIERCDTVKDLDQYVARIEEMIERKRRLFTNDICHSRAREQGNQDSPPDA